MKQKDFYIALSCTLMLACHTIKEKKPPPSIFDDDAGSGMISAGAHTPEDSAALRKALTIDKFQILSVVYGGERWASLSYNQSAKVEYVNWKACLKNKPAVCQQAGVSHPGHVIAGLSPGLWEIRVTPCRMLEKEEVCGVTQKQIYTQVKAANVSLNDELKKRSELVQKVRSLGVKIYKAAVTFKNSIGPCMDKGLSNIIPKDVYSKLVALGAEQISLGLLDENSQLVQQDDGGTLVVSNLGTVADGAKVESSAAPDQAAASSSDSDAQEIKSEASAKMVFAGGLLMIVVKPLIRSLVEKVVKGSKADVEKGVTKGLASTRRFIRTTYEAGDALTKKVMLGSLILTSLGVITYAVVNAGEKPAEMARKFAVDVLSLNAVACLDCAQAVQDILEAIAEAKELRVELQALTQDIQRITGTSE